MTAGALFGMLCPYAGSGHGAEPPGRPTLAIGGFMKQEIGTGFNSNGAFDEKFPLDQLSDNEVHFNFRAALAGGIVVNAHWELEASESSDVFDEAWMRVTGPYGIIMLGWNDSVAHDLPPDIPAVGLSIGDADGWIDNHTGSSSSGDSAFEDNDLRLEAADPEMISYITPDIAGLRLGVSYIPDADQEGAGGVSTGGAVYGNGVALALNYRRSLGDFRLALGAAWHTWFDLPVKGTRPEGYAVSAEARLGGFALGGGFLAIRDSFDGGGSQITDSQEGDGWQLGASYKRGPNRASLTYHHGEDENLLSNPEKARNDTAVASVRHAFAPGIDLYASLVLADFEGEVPGGDDDNRGWAMVSGIRVGF